jgi:monoamine oxidase
MDTMLQRIVCLLIFSVLYFGQQVLAQDGINCKVVVIGGGVGGLHTAYQLSKQPQDGDAVNVCLFEKESRLGGRVFDVIHDDEHPDMVYGLGALRVMEGQENIIALARELDITLVRTPYQNDLINARGRFVFSSDELLKAYPSLSTGFMNDSGFGTELAFHSLLLANRFLGKNYFDFRSFARDVLTPEGFEFLRDVTRLRGEYIRAADVGAYFSYYLEEERQCCVPSYPIGGMSQFVSRMAERAQVNGARITLSAPVLKIDKQAGEFPYQVITANFVANAQHVVIATDASSLNHIEGFITKSITTQPQFQDIIGIKVVVINQKWPKSWWIDSGYDGKIINRAWTTEHCLNFIEIPQDDYAARQHVTRSVYSDDPACNEYWENTLAKGGIKAVEREIYQGLKHLFPRANIPKVDRTIIKIWPVGWHWLQGGTSFSTDDITDWAVKPLDNEEVSLVGESYFISRSGWIDGAVRSSQNVLRRFHREAL